MPGSYFRDGRIETEWRGDSVRSEIVKRQQLGMGILVHLCLGLVHIPLVRGSLLSQRALSSWPQVGRSEYEWWERGWVVSDT